MKQPKLDEVFGDNKAYTVLSSITELSRTELAMAEVESSETLQKQSLDEWKDG